MLKTYTDGSQRKYYYDGIRVILEKTKPAEGSWTTSKVYTLAPGAIEYIISDREYSGGNYIDKWYHYDFFANITALSNSSGLPITSFDQEAFGNILSGGANGYHLTTKELHNDINLYYFFQRWYDPLLGRFISKDLIKYVNRYIYCLNNPIYFIDPSGLMTEEGCSTALNVICNGILAGQGSQQEDCRKCVTLCNQAANNGQGAGIGAGIFVQTCRRLCAADRTIADILAAIGQALEPGNFNPGAPAVPIPGTPPGTPGIPIPGIPRGCRP